MAKPKTIDVNIEDNGLKNADGNGEDRLTPEELRSYPGCEEISEQEAKEITASIHRLSGILYDLVTGEIAKGKVKRISKQPPNQQNLAA